MGPAGYLALVARGAVVLLFLGILRSASSTTNPEASQQASPGAALNVVRLPPLTIVRSRPVWKPRSVSILFSPLPGVKPTRQKAGAPLAQKLPRAVWTRHPQRRHRRSTTAQSNDTATSASHTSRQLDIFPPINEGDPPRVGEDIPPLPPQPSAALVPLPPPPSLLLQPNIKGPDLHDILRRDLRRMGDRTASAGSPAGGQRAGGRVSLQTRGAGATRPTDSRGPPGRRRKQDPDVGRHPESRHISRLRGRETTGRQDEDGRTRPQRRRGGTRATLRPRATRASSLRERQNVLPAARQQTSFGHSLGQRRRGSDVVSFWQGQWGPDPTSHRHDTHNPTVAFRGLQGEFRGPTTVIRGSTIRGRAEVAQEPTETLSEPREIIRGLTEALRGPTLRGLTESLRGPTETLQGPKEALRGPKEALRGRTETLRGPTETLRGRTETLRGPTETLRGRTEALRGQTPAALRLHQILARGSNIWAPQSGARVASQPFRPSLLSPETRREQFSASITQNRPGLGTSRTRPRPNPRETFSPATQRWRDVPFKAGQSTKREQTPKRAVLSKSQQKERAVAPPVPVRVHTPSASAPPHLSSSPTVQVPVSSTPKPARFPPSARHFHALSIPGKEHHFTQTSAGWNLPLRNHSASEGSSSSLPLSLVRKNVIKTEGKGDAKFKSKVAEARTAEEVERPKDQATSNSLFYSDFSDKKNLNTSNTRHRVKQRYQVTNSLPKLQNDVNPQLENVRAKDEIYMHIQEDNRKALNTLLGTQLEKQTSYLTVGENSKFRLHSPHRLPQEFSKLHYSGLVVTNNGLPLGYLYLNPLKPHHQVVFPLCEDCDPYPRSIGRGTRTNIVRTMTTEQLDSLCFLCTRPKRHGDSQSEGRVEEKLPAWCSMCQNSKTGVGLGFSRYNQVAQASLFDSTVASGSDRRSERGRIPSGSLVPAPITTGKKNSTATSPRDGLSQDQASVAQTLPKTLTSKQRKISEPTTPDVETKKPSATKDRFGPSSLKIPSFLLTPARQILHTSSVDAWKPIRQKDAYLPTVLGAPYADFYGQKIVPRARKYVPGIGRKIFRPSSLSYGGFVPIPAVTNSARGRRPQKKSSDVSGKWKLATSDASDTDQTRNAEARAVADGLNRQRIKRSALTTQSSEVSTVEESNRASHHRTKRGRLPVAGSPAHVKLEPMMPPVVFFTQDEQYRVLADVHKTMKRSLDMERLSSSVAETVSKSTPKPPLLDTRVTRTLKSVKDRANRSRDAVNRSRATGLLIPKSGGPVIEMNTNTKLNPSSIKQVFRYDIPSSKASSTSESSGRSLHRQPTRSVSASLRSILRARPTTDGKLRYSPSHSETGRKSKPAKRQAQSILSLLPGNQGGSTSDEAGLSSLQQELLQDTGGLTTAPPPLTPAPTGPTATTPKNEESLLFPGHPPPDIFSPSLVNRAPYRELLRPPLRTPPARPYVFGKQKYPPHGYAYGRKGFGGIGGLIRRVVHWYHRLIFGDAEERPEHLARRPYNPFLHQGLF